MSTKGQELSAIKAEDRERFRFLLEKYLLRIFLYFLCSLFHLLLFLCATSNTYAMRHDVLVVGRALLSHFQFVGKQFAHLHWAVAVHTIYRQNETLRRFVAAAATFVCDRAKENKMRPFICFDPLCLFVCVNINNVSMA